MNTRFWLSLICAACAAGASPAEPVSHVLFIGNSLTYVNDLPGAYAGICAAAGHPVETGVIGVGGATLTMHRQDPRVPEALKAVRWNAVVLQDQSSRPSLDPDGTAADAAALGEMVRGAGSAPVMYMTWGLADHGTQHLNQPMQRMLARAYGEAARAAQARVAPVGLAWMRALQARPALKLYSEDGVHPLPAGTYLAACVFYHTLNGPDAAQRPPPWRVHPRVWTLPWTIPDEDASFLNRIAAETVRSFDLQRMLQALKPVKVTEAELRAVLKPNFTKENAIARFGQMVEMEEKNRLGWSREGGGQLCLVWSDAGVLEKAFLIGNGPDHAEIEVH